MIALTLALVGLFFAAVPAVVFFRNLGEFRRLPAPLALSPDCLSVLIPARNEEASIGNAVRAVLANVGVEYEVLVLDDHSTDRTAEIVDEIARDDSRVRRIAGEALPAGWCGKQFACDQLARAAQYDLLVWIDADVRLAPDALARIKGAMREPIALLSGFPHQRVETFLEKLLLPLMHFILLGFLPVWMMRKNPSPAFGAGCGQLFAARRNDYQRAGGHAAIAGSLHDGVKLPRAFRRAGLATDIFDATDLADCRMYHSAGEVWFGLLKNAGEGLAAPAAIVPWTVILLLGQVLPLVLIIFHRGSFALAVLMASGLALLLSFTVRGISAVRFRQPWVGVWLHPLGIAMLLAIQWHSILIRGSRKPVQWRGREYVASDQEHAAETFDQV